MKKKLTGTDLTGLIGELAFGKTNDAVRLVFLDAENQEQLEGLDLRMVSEVKRGSNGTVEVKLLNRIALLELLAGLIEPEENEKGRAESFFSAMDKAAGRLGEGKA